MEVKGSTAGTASLATVWYFEQPEFVHGQAQRGTEHVDADGYEPKGCAKGSVVLVQLCVSFIRSMMPSAPLDAGSPHCRAPSPAPFLGLAGQ